MGQKSKSFLVFLALFLCVSTNLMAHAKIDNSDPASEVDKDFYKWIESEQGEKSSLARMKQRCDKVVEAEKNLNCSLFVFARMFEAKASNQLPEYYLMIKQAHPQAIDRNPELRGLFSMFGTESISTLVATPDFSAKRSGSYEVLTIHPYSSDFYISEQAVPYIGVSTANGYTAKLILDTGSAQTRINYETAKKMGINVLTDSHYLYKTIYGKSAKPAKLGILDSLKVGGSEFKNVLVFVSDEENILGLDLISKLGRLKITKNTLELNSEPPAQCDSQVVYYHAPMEMDHRLTIAALLDDRATLAIIDTGNNDYLTSALSGEKQNIVLPKSGNEMQMDAVLGLNYQTFNGVLDLPNNSMAMTYKYYPDFTIPPSLLFGQYVPSILLGWRAFDDFELNLDIESGRSCFNKI